MKQAEAQSTLLPGSRVANFMWLSLAVFVYMYEACRKVHLEPFQQVASGDATFLQLRFYLYLLEQIVYKLSIFRHE